MCALVAPPLAVFMMTACGLDLVGSSGTASLEDAALPDGNPSLDAETPPDATPKKEETCTWSSLERDAPWPMLGGCARHPGRTVHRGPKQKPKLVWKLAVTTRDSQLVIGANDTVYVPANTNGIVALDPDGGRRPIADTGTGAANNVTNSPSIGSDSTLYFGAEQNIVAHGSTGTRWRFDTTGEVDTSTVVDEDGTVYSGSFSDRVYAIGPDGGKRWEINLGADVWSSAAIGPDGVIYVASLKQLYALQRDGSQEWRVALTGDIHSSPVVADDGTIYIGTLGSRLHALHPDGGNRWVLTTRGNFGWQQLPALAADGTIYTPTGSFLAAVLPSDGGKKWERDLGVPLRTSVIVDGYGTLYVGGDKRMFAYDANGTELWNLDIPENPFGFAIGRDGTIYVACNNNLVLALHE